MLINDLERKKNSINNELRHAVKVIKNSRKKNLKNLKNLTNLKNWKKNLEKNLKKNLTKIRKNFMIT